MSAENVVKMSQMADPDSQSPAEVSHREQPSIVPPAGSSKPGLNDFAPTPDTELQEGVQRIQDFSGGEEEKEEGGADRSKPRPPLIHLRRGIDNSLIQKLVKVCFKTNTNAKTEPNHNTITDT